MAKITVNAPPNYSLCLVPKAERGRHKVLSGSTATLRFLIFSSPVSYLTYPTTLRPFLMVSYFLTYLYPNADSPCIVLHIYPSQLRLAVPGFRDFMSQSDSDSMPSYFKLTTCFSVLVPGHKYPKMEGDHSYGGTDTHGCFAIYFFNPCFRVLMAWDKYHTGAGTLYSSDHNIHPKLHKPLSQQTNTE